MKLLVECDEPCLRTWTYDSDIGHRNKAYQGRYVLNSNEQINRLNSDDFVDKFDNDIRLCHRDVLDLCAVGFEKV